MVNCIIKRTACENAALGILKNDRRRAVYDAQLGCLSDGNSRVMSQTERKRDSRDNSMFYSYHLRTCFETARDTVNDLDF